MPSTISDIGDGLERPIYYMGHPCEAYVKSYNIFLGQMKCDGDVYDAYTYYIPIETVRLIPLINEYFCKLISGGPNVIGRRRRKNHLSSIDEAVNLISRISIMNDMDMQVAVGSQYIKPVTWAIFGKGPTTCRMYKYQFETIESIIDHYVRRYEICHQHKQQNHHCHPVCIYHTENGRNALKTISNSVKFSESEIIVAGINLMMDMIEHGGPDASEFFDLYTNDSMCSPEEVDVLLWRKCRDAVLYEDPPLTKPQITTTSYVAVPKLKPRPTKIKITFTDEGDDLSKGCKITKFQEITITVPFNCQQEFYY